MIRQSLRPLGLGCFWRKGVYGFCDDGDEEMGMTVLEHVLIDAKTPEAAIKDDPLLIDAKGAAALCGICRTTWLSLCSAGKTPEPIRLGRRVLWRLDELRAWLDAGCPARHNWQWKERA
jgi:predicted DNA-binding transcriptional regulator AlpA